MLHLKTCTGCTDLPARYPLYRKINSFRLSITAYPLPPGSRRKGDGGGGGEGRGEKHLKEFPAPFSLHPTPLSTAVMQAINTEF